MLNATRAREICEQVLRASTADAVEVSIGGGIDSTTRFANNEIHQNMTSESYELSVRSIIGKRTGRASTSRLDAVGMGAVVEQSEAVTRLMPERDDLLPLLEEQQYATVAAAHDPSAAGIDAEARAEMAAMMIRQAQEANLISAGIVRSIEGDVGEYGEKGVIALANSKGLFAYHNQTWIKSTITVMSDDSSGWADSEAHDLGSVDPLAVGRLAVQKTLQSSAPRSIPVGDYTTILEPAAVAELLAFLIPEFSATVVDEGRSFLSSRRNEQVFGENIQIHSDPYHTLHSGRPFDDEGLPTKPVHLIQNGVQNELVYDRLAAATNARAASGHALRFPSINGATARCLVLQGGDQTIDEMVQSMQRGVLVTRVWYTRTVDPVNLMITGMTRDGTYWVEDGKIRHGVKNMRFNVSLIDLLQSVRSFGKAIYSWPAVVPALTVDGFHFTSETSF